MNREERVQYQDIRLLSIECDQPYDWDERDATHLRVCMPVSYENSREMLCRGFYLADRTLDVSINLTRSKLDFASMVRIEPIITLQRRSEVREIAQQSFPTDRRFHLSYAPDRAVSDKVLAGWVEGLSEYYLCEHKGTAIGFLALTGDERQKFVHLAAVLERYRTSGAALSLYAAAARDCKEAGVHFLNGRISSTNTAVINLYSCLGASFFNPCEIYLKEVQNRAVFSG